MNKKSNIIDFMKYRQEGEITHLDSLVGDNSLVDEEDDQIEIRSESDAEDFENSLDNDRRKNARTFLSQAVAAYVIVPGRGLQKISITNISEHGLSFDLEAKYGHYSANDEVAVRFYLNSEAYFDFVAVVRHLSTDRAEEVIRHGANFLKGTVNEQALFHFVKFIETVSGSLKKDSGDPVIPQEAS